jgi:hypothetical protein
MEVLKGLNAPLYTQVQTFKLQRVLTGLHQLSQFISVEKAQLSSNVITFGARVDSIYEYLIKQVRARFDDVPSNSPVSWITAPVVGQAAARGLPDVHGQHASYAREAHHQVARHR